jgi:DNA-binding NtrC family response regulator
MNPAVRKPAILVVDDVPDWVATLRDLLQSAGFETHGAESAQEALGVVKETFIDLLLLDQRLGRTTGTDLLREIRKHCPGLGGILISGSVDLNCALAGIRAGALDVLEKPVSEGNLISAISRALAGSELVRESRHARWRAERQSSLPGIIGESEALKRVLGEVRKVAATSVHVLIQGKSGSGKELIARAIHALSPRKRGPFVDVNAGALADTLLESTLFGSKKGAFTHSIADRRGLFETANGGTLFLDEIGETSPDLQVKLLRAAQEKVVMRVGDTTPIPVDTRIIAATNRDLKADVAANRFRQDLYFRLAVITITVPSLSERGCDIVLLANHFLERHSREIGKTIKGFDSGSLNKLEKYQWPGNVRELENVIQRAVILCDTNLITPNLLLLEDVTAPQANANGVSLDGTFHEAEESLRRAYFEQLYFGRAGKNKVKAAKLAEIDRSTLYDHLNKLGIS